MKKVDMSPRAISECLRLAGGSSEELLNSSFSQRYEALLREQAELNEAGPNVQEAVDDLSDNAGGSLS